jgi:hypothetical protein
MLPTTGLVGGCGIGLNLLLDAITNESPAVAVFTVIASEAKQSSATKKDWIASSLRSSQ